MFYLAAVNLLQNVSLKPYNTFGLSATAAQWLEITTINELQKALQLEVVQNQSLLILGGGSNILLLGDFKGVVLKNNILGKEIIQEDDEHVFVRVGAGENWHEFVLFALSKNWGGIENLSLIPGTVGAAPMQNIGAYGIEIKQVFHELEAVEIKTGQIKTFDALSCNFGYRESVFKNELKGQFIITHVTFRLNKAPHQLHIDYGAIKDTLHEMGIANPTIQDISKAVITIRQSKLPDPKQIGNSGSFFKNPTIAKTHYEALKVKYSNMPGYEVSDTETKVPAGWLIEQCGWKGYKRGEVGVHKNQALVLVNYGSGQGREIQQLAQDIQQSVKDSFNIELHPEVNFIG